MVGVDDEYVAYCLDQAVNYFGSQLSERLESVDAKTPAEGKRKRQQILDAVLTPGAKPKGRFMDPAAKFGG
jgi:hypothetical protein